MLRIENVTKGFGGLVAVLSQFFAIDWYERSGGSTFAEEASGEVRDLKSDRPYIHQFACSEESAEGDVADHPEYSA